MRVNKSKDHRKALAAVVDIGQRQANKVQRSDVSSGGLTDTQDFNKHGGTEQHRGVYNG